MPQVSIAKLFEDNREKLKLSWVAGHGGGAKELNPELTKDSSRGLIGHLNSIHPNLIQVLGGRAQFDREGRCRYYREAQ